MIGYGASKAIVPVTFNEILKKNQSPLTKAKIFLNKIATDKGKYIEYEVNASILEIYNE
jgi:hypothetical protein